jgi:hypothetical protein
MIVKAKNTVIWIAAIFIPLGPWLEEFVKKQGKI